LIVAVAATAISGCGRRGALEAPGSALGPEPLFSPPVLTEQESPGAQDPEATRQPAAPDRPFVLDPLI
jgi:hypothetical protein